MRLANDAPNNTPNLQDKERRTAEQIFSNTKTNLNTKYFKSFGYPTYALDNKLQQNAPLHKWKERKCRYIPWKITIAWSKWLIST